MNDEPATRPTVLDAILRDTRALGFDMASEPKTGAILMALSATKPGGRFLELGTGTRCGTSWLLAGMNADARLDWIDSDATVLATAQKYLGNDPRVTFHHADGAEFLKRPGSAEYDLIYADAWPGKFSHLTETLAALRLGGIYFVDDLLPQPNWPEGHAKKVELLMSDLGNREVFANVKLAWASGLMMLVRVS